MELDSLPAMLLPNYVPLLDYNRSTKRNSEYVEVTATKRTVTG